MIRKYQFKYFLFACAINGGLRVAKNATNAFYLALSLMPLSSTGTNMLRLPQNITKKGYASIFFFHSIQ